MIKAELEPALDRRLAMITKAEYQWVLLDHRLAAQQEPPEFRSLVYLRLSDVVADPAPHCDPG
jgi:hypothetical protein